MSSPFTWRGGEQQLFYLHHGLVEQRVNSVVFCPGNSVLYQQLHSDRRVAYKKQSGFDIRAALKLKKVCKSENIDIIHAHDAHAHTTSVLAALLGNKTPIVLSRRVDFPIKKKWFTRFKYNHKNIRNILSVSNAIQEIIRPAITAEHIGLKVVHSSCDTSRFQHIDPIDLRKELGLNTSIKIIGNVAALADHKDHHTFLKTAKQVLANMQDVVFVIVGSGELEEELKAKAVELGVSDHVRFMGFRDDLPRIYPNFDVFLFTSKTEGLGTSVLDAFANKLPVVTTNAGGIPEMVVHGKTGMLAPVGDDQMLANHVIELLKDSSKSNELVAGATEKLKEFSVDHMVSKTLEVYRKI